MQLYGMSADRGIVIWDVVCLLGNRGPFETKDAALALERRGFKPRTAQLYFNRFVRYALANPQEFSGPKSKLVRIRTGTYRLDDGVWQ